MYGRETLAMEVSSSSIKVARVTVRATTHGLMMGRPFGLSVGLISESTGELIGGVIAESISSTAVSGSSVNTASLAKVRPFLSLVSADRCEQRPSIYDD